MAIYIYIYTYIRESLYIHNIHEINKQYSTNNRWDDALARHILSPSEITSAIKDLHQVESLAGETQKPYMHQAISKNIECSPEIICKALFLKTTLTYFTEHGESKLEPK